MEIEEVKRLREELNEKIFDLIEKFESDTNTSIMYVNINSDYVIGKKEPRISSVNVDVRM